MEALQSPRRKKARTADNESNSQSESDSAAVAVTQPVREIIPLDPSDYAFHRQPSTVFQRPREIGHFSHDASRRYCYSDRSSLQVLRLPPSDSRRPTVNFDLRQGRDTFIDKNVHSERLTDLLRFFCDEKVTLGLSGAAESGAVSRRPPPDFVCWRGTLTNLLCTPYEQYNGWLLAVTYWRGTYYLCQFEPDANLAKKATESDRQKAMQYWGFKFEQYVTSDSPGEEPVTNVPVNCRQSFCSVVRTRLGSHSLVYGGEVDCYDSSVVAKHLNENDRSGGRSPRTGTACQSTAEGVAVTKDVGAHTATVIASTCDKDSAYVELKTSRRIDNPRQSDNFHRRKIAKWWAQSFLLNVPRIVCGFRDDTGIVQRVQSYCTGDMPGLSGGAWSQKSCLAYAERVLSCIKELRLPDDPRRVCTVEWTYQADRLLVTRDPTPHDTQGDFRFLPDWYIDRVLSAGQGSV